MMTIFEEMEKRGHEELIFNYFQDVDLKMIISLHDTTMGRTIGGLRMKPYDNDMEAIIESLRLSEAMTYQGATAETDCGGGSAILLGNPITDKNEAYFRAVGRFIESLKGRLIIAPDLGTEAQDFKHIQRETSSTIFGEDIKDNSRPTAQITAYGVYWGIKACAKEIFGTADLSGRTLAVQGLGNVGKYIVQYLKQENTSLFVSDLVYDNIKEVEDKFQDVIVVRPEDILFKNVDIVVPCAVDSVIDESNVDQLRCKIIAGSAINIFSNEELAERVHQKGILYAPALIAAGDLFLLDRKLKLGKVEEKLEGTQVIYSVLLDIFQRAASQGISPSQSAIRDAIERYKKIGSINNILC